MDYGKEFDVDSGLHNTIENNVASSALWERAMTSLNDAAFTMSRCHDVSALFFMLSGPLGIACE
jgi:hypothetical protein